MRIRRKRKSRKGGIRRKPDLGRRPTRLKPKAEASMFLHDFERWNDILKSMASSGAEVRSGNYLRLRFYYESMWQFWIEIYEIILGYNQKLNEDLEKRFDECLGTIRKFEVTYSAASQFGRAVGIPEGLIEKLRKLHRDLLRIKFKLNLGVWVSRPQIQNQV